MRSVGEAMDESYRQRMRQMIQDMTESHSIIADHVTHMLTVRRDIENGYMTVVLARHPWCWSAIGLAEFFERQR